MKFLKFLFYTGFFLFIALLVLTSNISAFFLPSSKEITKLKNQKDYPLTEGSYLWNNTSIEYRAIGNDTAQRIIMLHGSPGDWSNYLEIFKDTMLQRNFYLIAINRPGYGASEGNEGIYDLGVQADVVRSLCKPSSSGKKPILMGHSMGGPIVIKAAIDYGKDLEGVISVAGSFNPDLEPNEWYRGVFKTFPINLFFNKMLRTSNDELFVHSRELAKMENQWSDISCKVYIIQGSKDRLVAPGNMEFAKAHLKDKQAYYNYIEGEDHFIPFTRPAPIFQAIYTISGINPEPKLN